MDLKTFLIVFGTVFLAELGDKTQLATVLFAGKQPMGAVWVFLGASGALVFSTALATAVGASISSFVDPRNLSVAAGIGFIVIGIWTLWQAI